MSRRWRPPPGWMIGGGGYGIYVPRPEDVDAETVTSFRGTVAHIRRIPKRHAWELRFRFGHTEQMFSMVRPTRAKAFQTAALVLEHHGKSTSLLCPCLACNSMPLALFTSPLIAGLTLLSVMWSKE